MTPDHITRNIETAEALLAQRGLTLHTGTCFEEFKRLSKRQASRPPVNPSFDVDAPEGQSIDGFWLAGYNAQDELVHSQAIKYVDLGGNSLHDHLCEGGDQYRIAGYDLDMSRAQVTLTEEARGINGRFAYHGELWSQSGQGGLRGDGTLPLLSRIMLLKTLAHGAPEHILGFISPTNACRGLAARLGYVHLEQRSVVYPRVGSDETLEGWMVWMTGQEAAFNLRIEPEFFARMFKPLEEDVAAEKRLVA